MSCPNAYRLVASLCLGLLSWLIVLPPSISKAQPAQAGRIAGVVRAPDDDQGLPGVHVYLEETSRGVATGLDGRFVLRQVRPGTYTIVASLLGYGTIRQEVAVDAGLDTEINLVLTPSPIELEEVLAMADQSYSAASSMSIRAFDMMTRPTRSAQDLLRLTPGLVTAQHAGGGKAEQIFLRGFDADHGTDVAIAIDGMPVNMVSHGHGQGYADLHFIIPETVEQIQVQKGPYRAAYGNLATAGAIALSTKEHLEHNLIQVEGGAFNTASVTTLYQIPLPGENEQTAYLAGQFYHTDGPVASPQGFQRFNLFSKFHTHLSEDSKLALSIGGFSSAWDASGQIPVRAVQSGLVDRFGSLDDLEGGTTGRQNVNLTYEAASGNGAFLLQSYVTRYTFKLFSNFTFFLEDPLNGDMIEQTDNRDVLGVQGQYSFAHSAGAGTTTLGGGFRNDDVAVMLWTSPNRIRQTALVHSDIVERNLFLWAEQEYILSPLIRLQLGLRGDYFTYDVNDVLDGDSTATLPHASGFAQQAILNPKASLVISPTRTLDLYVNAGSGFHSNDARNNVISERVTDLARVLQRQGLSDAEIDARLAAQNYDPGQRETETLPRAVGGEVGFRVRPWPRVNIAATGWGLTLEREYVYVGDGGFTELSGASRRYGLDLEARVGLTRWLTADADLNLSRGILVDEPDDTNHIPLAPRVTSTGGLTVQHPSGLEGTLRYVHIGDRPANEDGSVTAAGYTIVNLLASYRFRAVKVTLSAENLLDVAWNEAQFDTESRLWGEVEPVSELHFTPGNPRNLRLSVAYLF